MPHFNNEQRYNNCLQQNINMLNFTKPAFFRKKAGRVFFLSFKFESIIESMNFYEKQEEAIANDARDNELIEMLVKNYSEVKVKFECASQENVQLAQEIVQLKELNQKLQEDIASLKADNKKQEAYTLKINGYPGDDTTNFFRGSNVQTPIMFNRTVQRTASSQTTKRRVINGFVGELTLQLQQSEEMLKKQRKMQEETRRTLLTCSEELSTLRITVKELQNRALNLTLQNQKLFKQLQQVLKQKRKIEEQYSVKIIQKSRSNKNLMIDMEEYQAEMDRMDNIYKSIECQLRMQS